MGLVFVGGLLFWGWIEISAFIFVSNVVGGLLTLLGVFLTAVIGITFLKKQGLSVLNRVRGDLAKGHAPVASIADSISLVIGGGLMLIPGYITDGIGLLLFIPGVRTMAGMHLLQWVAKKPHYSGFVDFGGSTLARENGNQNPFGFSEQPHQQNNFDDVIEGEFTERPDAKSDVNQKKGDRRNDR